MCGRFTLRTPESTVATLFPELNVPDLVPRYNIAPTQQVTCVRENRDSVRELVPLRWGLVPGWSKDLKIGARMINARSETVAEKPSFRTAFKKRRCLVIADGYFEWKKVGKEKQPYYMTRIDSECGFCMAGLWESWTDKDSDQTVETCTVLTTDASPSLAAIHDRMPVVIGPDEIEFWLDCEFDDVEKLRSVCKPQDDGFFKVQPVNKIVNNVRNDSVTCIEVIKPS